MRGVYSEVAPLSTAPSNSSKCSILRISTLIKPDGVLKHWNGSFFAECSLRALGQVVQLGHAGQPCPNSQPMDAPLTVIDVSGIHTVTYAICGCPRPLEESLVPAQLMSLRWWPATFTRPNTVATQRVCKLFHALSLQSKTNAYDFWSGLLRITDGAGLRKVAVSSLILTSLHYSIILTYLYRLATRRLVES
jgi:hypothetical protein